MSADLLAPAASPRRADQAACWQFDIASARPLLGEGLARRDVEWGRDGLEKFLAAVRIVDVNEAAIRLFGLPADRARVIARPVDNLWPERSHAELADLLASVAAQDGQPTETREIGTMDRWTDVVLTGWRPSDPACRDMIFVSVGATLDATGALLELEASQHRYRNLISSLPMPVWEVDARAAGRIFDRLRADGVTDMDAYSLLHPELVDLACEIVLVVGVNREAVALMGADDRSELLGPVKYLFTGTLGSARRVLLAHFSGHRNYVEEVKIRTFDGRVLDVLLMFTLPIPGERLDTTLIMMIDNTPRLEAEARLRQVEADFTHAARLSTLGEMTASIAHEVKQPLSAILTNAETSLRWLDRAEPNLPKVAQLSERIAASAQRATEIITRIQDMARKRQPDQVRLDLNDLIREALMFTRHDREQRSIRMRLDLAADLPPLIGDRIQLQQVVVNLLVNSAQALEAAPPEQREIHVTTCSEGQKAVAFSIRDTGPGIPEGDLDRVFSGFFSTKEGGMGIGLTICQSIVAAHGGTITASRPPAGGAEFRVVIPREPTRL